MQPRLGEVVGGPVCLTWVLLEGVGVFVVGGTRYAEDYFAGIVWMAWFGGRGEVRPWVL